jgi:pescadillo
VYIQPQWVFDCINANMLLPCEDYLPGAILPPHLSPFVDETEGEYVPPEKQRLLKMKLGIREDDKSLETIIASLNNGKENENSSLETNKAVETKNNKKKQLEKKEAKTNEESKENNLKRKADKVKPENAKKKTEQEINEESKDEEDLYGDMRVDLDSPDEEKSEQEEEESENESNEGDHKKGKQVF